MHELHRHKKRGTTYELLGIAEAQVSTPTVMPVAEGGQPLRPLREGDKLAVYRAEDGIQLWVRFEDEFRDGRFENVTPARKWWPDNYADEIMPEGLFAPDDWIVGRVPAMAGAVLAPRERDEAHDYGCVIVAEDEVVSFMWVEPRGATTITIFADGTWRGSVPDDFTHCWEDGEIEQSGDTVDEVVRNILNLDPLGKGDEVDVDLRFCKWGDADFRLAVEDGRAKFVAVEAETGGGHG